jgi:hypothetical protein
MPGLAQRLGIRIVAGPFVLGSEHDGLTIVEADRVETVKRLRAESGLVQ